MSSLVIAEHDNTKLKASTRNTLTAALQLGGSDPADLATSAKLGEKTAELQRHEARAPRTVA